VANFSNPPHVADLGGTPVRRGIKHFWKNILAPTPGCHNLPPARTQKTEGGTMSVLKQTESKEEMK
jgi:hypothetical protein